MEKELFEKYRNIKEEVKWVIMRKKEFILNQSFRLEKNEVKYPSDLIEYLNK